MGFVHGFEHERCGLRVRKRDVDWCLVCGLCGLGGVVARGFAVFGDEIQDTADADVFGGGGRIDGEEQSLVEGIMDVGAEFFFGEGAGFKEVFHEGIFRFSNRFDELAVEVVDLVKQGARGGSFLVGT